MCLDEIVLSQTQRNGVGFALTLAAHLTHRVSVEQQVDVVAVHAVGGVANNHVAVAVSVEQLMHRAVVKVAAQLQLHLLGTTGNGVVVAHEDGRELVNPAHAGSVDCHTRFVQLMLNSFKEQRVAHALLDERITVFERLVVANQMRQIFLIALSNNLVHEPSALLARAANQIPVHGRHHHQRQQPDVLAEALIFLAVALERLAFALLISHSHLQRLAAAAIAPAQHHIVGSVIQHQLVAHVAAALHKAQIIYGVEHVGLAHAIIADKAIDVGRKIELTFNKILEIYYRDVLQIHCNAKLQKTEHKASTAVSLLQQNRI